MTIEHNDLIKNPKLYNGIYDITAFSQSNPR